MDEFCIAYHRTDRPDHRLARDQKSDQRKKDREMQLRLFFLCRSMSALLDIIE